MTASDPFHLQRFVDAQAGIYDRALEELRSGSKRSHWMWFIFPQLAALGRSPTARYYGMASADEATAYLAHPVVGPHLHECVEALLPWAGKRLAAQILGEIDAMKLKSSLTLFDAVQPGALFDRALLNFFGGERDQLTLALLQGQQ
ncbi:MAG: DUF1810 domain-containing protein [Bacillota bacterium]